MTNGIGNEVAIIGMGCSSFGALESEEWTNLVRKTVQEALEDSGIGEKDIDACWFNTHSEEMHSTKSEISLKKTIGLSKASVTKTDNFYSGMTDAFHSACYAVASGLCDIGLALGAVKQKNIP